MITKPLVSIVVPCYNQAQFLDECLQSVFNQKYSFWECLIINDGSTDNTKEISENWITKDNRFKYFEKVNGGISSARNYGIERAMGEWILPLDADDKISSEYCSNAACYFDKPSTKVIYGQAKKFGLVAGEWYLPKFSVERLAVENLIYCSAFFRKEDWIKLGGYDENMVEGLEDWEFWINLLKNETAESVIFITDVCFFYRIKSVSRSTEAVQSEENLRIYIVRKHPEFYSKAVKSIAFRNEALEKINSRLVNRIISKVILFRRKNDVK